jgi:hypothetical protein
MAMASRASDRACSGFARGQQLIVVLGATEGGGLFEGEVAAIDENAVVD